MIPSTNSITWKSPSNIAFVKYWGKKPKQVPVNPSLSMVLSRSVTTTKVVYTQVTAGKTPEIVFRFDGKSAPDFEERVIKYIHLLKDHLSFIPGFNLSIDSSNTFPHSAGIASSASAISALALCFCSIEEQFTGRKMDNFFQYASFLSRLGSGSACRSVYSGFSTWGDSPFSKNSSNFHAIPVEVNNLFGELHDAILVVDSGKKTVPSSAGHALMERHAYLEGRINQSNQNMKEIMQALQDGDFNNFSGVVENEALSLHGLMMSSKPGYLLLQPRSLVIINKIISWREASRVPCTFTIDAGPNIHLIYPGYARDDVLSFIKEYLIEDLENGRWIDDKIGSGPEKIEQV